MIKTVPDAPQPSASVVVPSSLMATQTGVRGPPAFCAAGVLFDVPGPLSVVGGPLFGLVSGRLVSGEWFVVSGTDGARRMFVGNPGAPIGEPGVLATGAG